MEFFLGVLVGFAACYGYMRYAAPVVTQDVAKVEQVTATVKADLIKKD